MADNQAYRNDYPSAPPSAGNYLIPNQNPQYYQPPEDINALIRNALNEHAYQQGGPANISHNIPMNTMNQDRRPLPERQPPPSYIDTIQPLNASNDQTNPSETRNGGGKSGNKRCLCYTVLFVVVLVICGAGIGITYLLTSKSSTSEPDVQKSPVPVAIRFCPEPIRTDAPPQSDSASVYWDEPLAENPANISSIDRSHMPWQLFNIGSTVVRYTFTDKGGNTGTCSFDVTVVDVTPPVVTNCPVDETYNTPSSGDEDISWVEPTSTDNSGGVIRISKSHQLGFAFPAGDTKVSYQFIDQSGNQASCVFTIRVTTPRPPDISECPVDLTQTTQSSSVPVWWEEPAAVFPGVTLTRSHRPGDIFGVGQTTVTYTFTGDQGLQTVCEFKVTVHVTNASPPEVLDCPQDMTREAPSDGNLVAVWWTAPTATSRNGRVPSIEPSHMPGDNFIIGPTRVNYVFVDDIGLRTTCSFHVTVTDVTAPSVQGCPQNIRNNGYTSTEDNGVRVAWPEPTVTDNSGEPVTIDKSHQPGSYFFLGATEVRYVFRDQSGQETVCTFLVTTPDFIEPSIHQCPKDMEFKFETGELSARVYWTRPYAIDNSGNATLISSSHESGQYFMYGVTTVMYVFADASGNIADCSFTLTGSYQRSAGSTTATSSSIGTSGGVIVLVIIIYYCCCRRSTSRRTVVTVYD